MLGRGSPLLEFLAGHVLGCVEPDARIYALAQARFSEFGPVRPMDIIFFDDLAENVAAARAAGWSAFQVDPTGNPVEQMPSLLVDAGVLPPAAPATETPKRQATN